MRRSRLEHRRRKRRAGARAAVKTLAKVLDIIRLWSLPLNPGQMFVVAGYAVFALICIVVQAPLMENANRASPWGLALLDPGVDYMELNYIHRCIFGCPTIGQYTSTLLRNTHALTI
ncbi:hypothetical protein K438DRAFT_1984747 [Mycena galopus ATCC 62051]|nr:hypothetical protein K438DRAFT_1984747 [Mycena galopus ATCC 62051]